MGMGEGSCTASAFIITIINNYYYYNSIIYPLCNNILTVTHDLQLDVSQAELELYRNKCTAGERQMKEAQGQHQTIRETIAVKQRFVWDERGGREKSIPVFTSYIRSFSVRLKSVS